MKLKEAQKKANFKFWTGLLGSLTFTFILIITLLKSAHTSLEQSTGLLLDLRNQLEVLINFIYRHTDFLTFFWSTVWELLPVFNPSNLLQESNYYFFALLAITLIFITRMHDGRHIKSKIKELEEKVADEQLENDMKKQKGLIATATPDLIEFEINVGGPDSWYKRPLGIITIGLFVAIVGKIVTALIGIES